MESKSKTCSEKLSDKAKKALEDKKKALKNNEIIKKNESKNT